jgi:hypothetical protein
MRPHLRLRRKSTAQRVLDAVQHPADAARAVSSGLPDVTTGKAVKTGLIAAGSAAGLTAGSAAISSLRRRADRARGDS